MALSSIASYLCDGMQHDSNEVIVVKNCVLHFRLYCCSLLKMNCGNPFPNVVLLRICIEMPP